MLSPLHSEQLSLLDGGRTVCALAVALLIAVAPQCVLTMALVHVVRTRGHCVLNLH